MGRVPLLAALVVLAVCGLSGCEEGKAPPREPAPPFELSLLGGGTVGLSDYAGRWLLLDFWATWCPPCIKEIPELNAFDAAYPDDQVALLAIAVDPEEHETLGEWVREHDLQYPVGLGDMDVARDFDAFQFPTHVLVSPEGQIAEVLSPGYHTRDELYALMARHR